MATRAIRRGRGPHAAPGDVEASRFVLAEEVTTEIFDGATPRSTYVRGVIVDGDGGVVLTGETVVQSSPKGELASLSG